MPVQILDFPICVLSYLEEGLKLFRTRFTDLEDLNPQYVQIRVRCCKCGKLGLTSAELEWSPVFWDAVYLQA